jgi:four helix bundle protein
MGYSPFEKLDVWQKAHELTLDVYKLTDKFPTRENYRITNQLCRAVSSVCANIVEGNARGSFKDYLRFLFIARGSLEETRYFLILSKDLGYLTDEQFKVTNNKSIEIGKMLNGLINSIKKKCN